MATTKFLKGECSSCGGHIEFPAESIGSVVPCPHCGVETELMLAEPEIAAASPTRHIKWAIVGGCILVAGLAAIFLALHLAQKRLPARQSRRDRPPATNVAVPTAAPAAAVQAHTNEFTSSPVSIQWQPGSTLGYATGTIANQRDARRFGVTVQLDVFNANGERIGTAKDYRDSIEPKAEWHFRALLLQTNAASVRVIAVHEDR